MKVHPGVSVLSIVCCCFTAALGGNPIITSFQHDGQLVWTNDISSNVSYRVMSAPQMDTAPSVLVHTVSMGSGNIHSITSRLVSATGIYDIEMFTNWPSGMVLVPASSFVMGDTFGGEFSNEYPAHTNYISAFYISQNLVTKDEWDEVYNWAATNGYTFKNVGFGKSNDHPVVLIDWWDCIKWANARSELEGLPPCYTVTGVIYRTGNSNTVSCNWSANGYRLPTEAEWEKAARGGASKTRFPWSDSDEIQHARANYIASPAQYSYDTSPTSGNHPVYRTGAQPWTSPAGSFAPNGYGICDVAGNADEWVWDTFQSDYYSSSPNTDPCGPSLGFGSVTRGGGYNSPSRFVRVSYRRETHPSSLGWDRGFRLVRAAQ